MKKGAHDLAVVRAAFERRLADAVPMARVRIRYWERQPDGAPVATALKAMVQRHVGRFVPKLGLEGPTPETLAQVARGHGDPVLRLHAREYLTDDQVRAAREIARLFAFETRGLGHQTMRYAYSTGGTGWTEDDDWLPLLHVHAYLPWTDQVRDDLALVLGLCVEGVSLEALRRRHKMRWATALARVRTALDLYGRMRQRYVASGAGSNARVRRPGS